MTPVKYPSELVQKIKQSAESKGISFLQSAEQHGFNETEQKSAQQAYYKFKRKGVFRKARAAAKKAKRPNVPFFQDIPAETYNPPTQEETFAVLLVNRSRLREVMGELCR